MSNEHFLLGYCEFVCALWKKKSKCLILLLLLKLFLVAIFLYVHVVFLIDNYM